MGFVGEMEAESEQIETPIRAEVSVISDSITIADEASIENENSNDEWLEPFREISKKRWNQRMETQVNTDAPSVETEAVSISKEEELTAYRELLDSSFPPLDRRTCATAGNPSKTKRRMRKPVAEIPEKIEEVSEKVEEMKLIESDPIEETEETIPEMAVGQNSASCVEPVKDEVLIPEIVIPSQNGEVEKIEAVEDKSSPSIPVVQDGTVVPVVEPIYRAASELRVQELHRLTSQALACIQLAEFKCDEAKLISLDTLTSYNADIMKARIGYCLAMLDELDKSAADFEDQAAAMPNLERISFC